MIPEIIKKKLAEWFLIQGKPGMKILSVSALSGGCINESYQISTTEGKYFIKYNLSSRYPGMFDAEGKGLQLLRAAKEIRIPEPLMTDECGDYSFILQEYIWQGAYASDFWNDFGRRLARLHRHTKDFFGLDHNNYIGSLRQSNKPCETWIQFFIEERLQPQIRLALDDGKFSRVDLKSIERFFQRLPDLIPTELPALLHGDLWSGNFITDESGNPCLIDPAVYYGHREADLAMTKLFGGFNVSFYEAYNEEFRLEPGWRERVDYFNLYPLMVHVNLFGGSYVSSVETILRRF